MCCRNKSPVDRLNNSYFFTSLPERVPFPAPGFPNMIILSAPPFPDNPGTSAGRGESGPALARGAGALVCSARDAQAILEGPAMAFWNGRTSEDMVGCRVAKRGKRVERKYKHEFGLRRLQRSADGTRRITKCEAAFAEGLRELVNTHKSAPAF